MVENSKAVAVGTSPRGVVATSPHEVEGEVATLHREGEVGPVASSSPEDVASQEDVEDLPHGVVGTSRHVAVGISRHAAVGISRHGAVGTSRHGAVGTLHLGGEVTSMPLTVEALLEDHLAVICLEDHRCVEDQQ